MSPHSSTLTPEGLQQAGFIRQPELPSGTRYAQGDLYMRLHL
ncbi:hypothetical protein [Hymenobacter gummosus]|nr:hypothetical protein [Hymenobacter gummosus]